jgi:SAM-dependent methyltransferase
MVDWEQRYQDGDTPWDKGAAHPVLAVDLPRLAMAGRGLVPGCGYGYDIEAIAEGSKTVEVVGLDVAQSAVRRARQLSARFGERVRIEEADLFALPLEFQQGFDWVFEHTCFCAIDPSQRDTYVDAVAGALRTGGQLLDVFYLRPWDTEEENRTSGPPFGVTVEELDRRFGRRFDLVESWAPAATYAGREGREIVRLLRVRDRRCSRPVAEVSDFR